MIVGVAIGNQNLAKMKIAVNRSHDHTYAETRERANGSEKAAELTLKHFGTLAILLALPSLEPGNIVESQTDALFRLPRPVFGVITVRNLGCKGGCTTSCIKMACISPRRRPIAATHGLAI